MSVGQPDDGPRLSDATADPGAPEVDEQPRATPDEAALGAIVARLARRHKSGGRVVERSALLAEGADFAALLAWIEAHDGVPEEASAPARAGGLFGDRHQQPSREPLRFVLPATAFA